MLYFQPDLFAQEKEPYATVTIDGLRDTYRVGEPVDFLVKVEGYGCDFGFPHVSVIKVSGNASEVVWYRIGEIRLLPAGVECPLTDIYQVRHISDVQRYNNVEQERLRTSGVVPIVLEEGSYAVHVEGGNARSGAFVKEFVVVGR